MIGSRQFSFLRQFVTTLALTTGPGTAFAGAPSGDAPSVPATACAIELVGDLARFTGSVRVHEEDGRVHDLADFRIVEFGAQWPKFEAAAAAVGWDRVAAIAIARPLLKPPTSIMTDPARTLGRLIVALRAAADRGHHFGPDAKRFAKLVERLEKHNLAEHAFYNLTFAVRAGLTLDQAGSLFTIIGDRHTYLGVHTFNHLQDLLKTMDEYAVSPSVAFPTLRIALSSPTFQNDMLGELTKIIKRDVLLLGRPADEFLLTLDRPDAYERIAKQLRVKPRGVRPYFTEVTGRLRHAEYPYAVKRSYADGLNDLRALCLDETCLTEGAFVFSPDRGVWYSLGGTTSVSAARARHEFATPDWSAFGSSPKFVHVHPRELGFLAQPSPTNFMTQILGPLVNRYAVITPSTADLELLVALNLDRPERDFELELVTQTGVTNVAAGIDHRTSLHLLPYYLTYRDDVISSALVTDYLGLPPLNQLDKLIVDLNDRMRRAFEVTLYPWDRP